jgi:hypothetical protein
VGRGAAEDAQHRAGRAGVGPGRREAAALVERRERGVGADALAGGGDRSVFADLLDPQAQLLRDAGRLGGRRRAGAGPESDRDEEDGGQRAGGTYQRRTLPVSTWMKSERA